MLFQVEGQVLQGLRFVSNFVILFCYDKLKIFVVAEIMMYGEIFQGKFMGIFVCWILGFGSLVSWNSLLSIGDYYYALFPVSFP